MTTNLWTSIGSIVGCLLPHTTAILTASSTSAATFTIEPDGSGDYPTIQEAIWYIADGDVLELADGVFTGEFNYEVDLRSKTITIRSQSGNSEDCVIDCGGFDGFILDGEEGSATTFEKLTVRNARQGFVCDGPAPTIRECTIVSCQEGVYSIGDGPTVIDCRFEGNQKAVFMSGAATSPISGCQFEGNTTAIRMNGASTSMITNSTFELTTDTAIDLSGLSAPVIRDCRLSAGQYGITGTPPSRLDIASCRFEKIERVAVYGSIERVQDCEFIGNGVAGTQSTAVAVPGEPETIISGNLFEGNRGLKGAGLILLGGTVTVSDCDFRQNGDPAGQGGAFAATSSRLTLDGCLFDENFGMQGGAGYGFSAVVSFVNCTIVRNIAPEGSTMFCSSTDVELHNSIVALQSGSETFRCEGNMTVDIFCSDLWGNPESEWNECIADQEGANGNFSLDPLFCDVADGDFSLMQESPCSEENSDCGLVGALSTECGSTPLFETSWGRVKAQFRTDRN